MPDFWQFPTGSMGFGPINADLPGALHALPRAPRARRRPRAATSGACSATARWTSRNRSAASRSPRARSSTTSPSSSTATCSASTARCAATARSSRSWSRCSPAPAGTSSRCCGARIGTRCSRATRSHVLLRQFAATVDGEYQTLGAKDGALQPASTSSARSGAAGAGRAHDDAEIDALKRGGHDFRKLYAAFAAARAHQRPADRHPGQDQEGLRHGRRRRIAHDRAPAEEARRRRAAGIPRPLRTCR